MNEFVANVAAMRHWQKAFFKSERGSAEKAHALEMSRQYERIVDNLIKKREDAPGQEGLDL